MNTKKFSATQINCLKNPALAKTEAKLLSFTNAPMYFNTKKSKSRKRDLGSKTMNGTRKGKNLSNSDKKRQSKVGKSFLASFLSDTTLCDNFSPKKLQNNVGKQQSGKNGQVLSIGSDTRVYTPDQLQQIYDESIIKYKSSGPNGNLANKHGKKSKRGVKTSYGNYTQLRPQSSFIPNNKIKLSKGRKSVTGSNKQSFYMSPKAIDSFNIGTKKSSNKHSHKLKIPSTKNKAYERLVKNMSMFSLESPNAAAQGRTIGNKKHSSKKFDGQKKKKKGGNISGSRNKYRTNPFTTKNRIQSSSSVLDNHIIITPTSSTKGREIIVPRIGSRKEKGTNLTKLDISQEDSRIKTKIQSALGSPLCNFKSYDRFMKKKTDYFTKPDESFSEDVRTQMNSGKLDSSMAHTFMAECETLEEAMHKMLEDIDKDQHQSIQAKQHKKLEVVRHLCAEMAQKRTHGAISKLFGYFSDIYEAHISTLSLSKIEALQAENKELQRLLENERQEKIKITKDFKSQIEVLNKKNSSDIQRLQNQIEELREAAKKPQKQKKSKHNESEESDIFEGLNTDKRDRIMAEVAELYEANVELQMENKILKKTQKKLKTGIQFIDTKEVLIDSMDMESEEEEGPFVKNGSYTDNEDLGKSHNQDTIGSIHNIFVDPTSESFIEERKKELAFKRPSIVPELDFNQIIRPDLVQAIKLKAFGVNNKASKPSQPLKGGHSLSNRVHEEQISFNLEGNEDDSASETCEKMSDSIEMKNSKFKSSKSHTHSHIMAKDLNNITPNLNEDSQNFGSNICKLQNSCFASSSEATKKKESGVSKPFSPFQNSESTVKLFKKPSDSNLFYKTSKSKDRSKVPQLNLENIEHPNFHQEFMDTWQEF
ncbi:unnamed protein product [Moneuplotes crassus]|uniref:Uncharacterized protein n=1 Tax=Euplotes crassus TaxID=5936 RepID=A0AAD2D8E6_EUPCR|nr:unnamed protein product [Moneuplotes crassus]